MTSVSMTDFQNLLQPGEIGDLNIDIQKGLTALTTTAVSKVTAPNVQALGPLVTAIKNAASATQFAAPAAPASGTINPSYADVKNTITKYSSIPTIITGFTPPTIPATSLSGPPTPATTNPTYLALINYIKESISDIGSQMIPNIIQQNAAKTDPATLTALQVLITAYINYLNGIVAAFMMNMTEIDINYENIIANIEKILNKIGIAVKSPNLISIADLYSLVQPLPAVVAQTFTPPAVPARIPPVTQTQDGSFKLNSDSGYNRYGGYATQFPSPTQIICLNLNPVSGVPNIPIWPGAGWPVTGQYIQGGTTVVSAGNTQVPSNPYINGIMITLSKPMVGLRGQGDQGSIFTYTFTPPPGTPAALAAPAAYTAAQTAYESAVNAASGAYSTAMTKYNALQSGALSALPRPTPNAVSVESANSINTSLNALVATKGIGALKSQKAIVAIKSIPEIFNSMANYILGNNAFLVTIGNQGSYVAGYLAPIYPIPRDLMKLFTGLTLTNFEASLTQPNTGIIPVLVSKYTSDVALNLIQKIVSKANSTLGSEAQKTLGGSILTKIYGFYIMFLNKIITAFKIDLSNDIAINPHITLLNKVLGKQSITLLTVAPRLGGGRRRYKKCLTRKRQKRGRRHITKRR